MFPSTECNMGVRGCNGDVAGVTGCHEGVTGTTGVKETGGKKEEEGDE